MAHLQRKPLRAGLAGHPVEGERHVVVGHHGDALAGEPPGVGSLARADVEHRRAGPDGLVAGQSRELGGSAGDRPALAHGVAALPVVEPRAQPAEPVVEGLLDRLRGLELEGGVGVAPAGPVHRLQQLLGTRRHGDVDALEGGGGQRVEPVLLERDADLAHEVEAPGVEEAGEDVDAAPEAVGLADQHLERGTAVADALEAPLVHRPLQPEGLPDDVDRGAVLADVGDVGVAVVAEDAALAHGPEQGAVADERTRPCSRDGLQHRDRRRDQRRDVAGAARLEGRHQPPGLVDAERDALVVDDADPLLGASRRRPRRRSGRPRWRGR